MRKMRKITVRKVKTVRKMSKDEDYSQGRESVQNLLDDFNIFRVSFRVSFQPLFSPYTVMSVIIRLYVQE